jgi:hypothetical protein
LRPTKEEDWKFDNVKLWLSLKDLIHFSARKLRLGTELRGNGMAIDYAVSRILSMMVLRQAGRSAATFGRRSFEVTSEEWA